MRYIKLLIAILLLAAGTAVGAQEAGTLYSNETVPCPSDVVNGAALAASSNEVEGQTFSCGVVVVPEDYSKPDGRTIELFYLKLHSSSQSPAPDPLIYLSGGPSSSGSLEAVTNPLVYQNLQKIRERRDIIAYDQRGTGFSNFLLCAPFESAVGILQDRDANPEIGAALADLQSNNEGLPYRALLANLCSVVTSSLAGVDFAQYNSVASAQDIARLAESLGYTGEYNLAGISYGTRLAQYAMRETPNQVRSVVLAGVTGTAIPNTLVSFAKTYETYVEIFAQCAANADCNAAYPNLAERFGTLLNTLDTTPMVFDPPLVLNPALAPFFTEPVLNQIDAKFFVGLTGVNNSFLSGGLAGSVPRMILAAEQNDTEYFRTSILAAPPPAPEAEATPAVEQPEATPAAGPEGTPAVEPASATPAPAFQATQPQYELPFSTLMVLAQAAAAETEPGLGTQWLNVVLSDFNTRLQAGENQADLMEHLLYFSVLPNTGTTAQVLIDFANAHLSPAAATSANAIVGQMTRNDVRSTLWSVQDVAMRLGSSPDARNNSDTMGLAFNCADEVAFYSLDTAQSYLDASPYPQLQSRPIAFSEFVLNGCLSYPKPLDRSVADPVVSDIPALLYLQALDSETPISWGRSVAQGLSHSLVVEWNNSGHSALAHDNHACAGDIAAAFLDDPTRQPNLTCAQSDLYKLQFVLPE